MRRIPVERLPRLVDRAHENHREGEEEKTKHFVPQRVKRLEDARHHMTEELFGDSEHLLVIVTSGGVRSVGGGADGILARLSPC